MVFSSKNQEFGNFPTLTLRQKTYWLIGIVLIILWILLFNIPSNILLKGFAELERKLIEKNTNRFFNVLVDEQNKLNQQTSDYAVWNDTYQYMKILHEDYIDSNFPESTFTNLNINIVALWDSQVRLVFGRSYSAETKQLGDLPPSLLTHLEQLRQSNHSLLTLGSKTGELLQLPEGILVIGASQILNSAHQGPSRGVMLMGRYLDSNEIKRLNQLTYLSSNIQSLQQTQLPPDFNSAYSEIRNSQRNFASQLLYKHLIAGYLVLRDVSQQPIALLRVDMIRDTYQQGLLSLRYLNIFAFISAVVFTVLILWLFEHLILVRLALLSKQVSEIRTTGVPFTVTVSGNDELAHLATTINEMLSALNISHNRVLESESSLAKAQHIAHLGNWEWDVVKDRIRWSDEIYRILGLVPQTVPPSHELFLKHIHAEDYHWVVNTIENARKESKPYSIEHRIIQTNGTKRFVHIQGEFVYDAEGKLQQMIGTLQDITERKLAQAETMRLLEENRFLIARSIAIQEKERRDLARELHDEFGQCITAIQADAEIIMELSQTAQDTDIFKKIHISANAIFSVSTHMYDVVHSLMRQLRPIGLDDLSLVEVLQETLNTWQTRHADVHCRFNFSGKLNDLGETVNIMLYRIVQECLTNIAKYAKATKVQLDLHDDSITHTLVLQVTDNGVGMDPQKHKRGLGLIGMRERVQALDGTLSLESALGRGVQITVTIPIDEKYQQKRKSWREEQQFKRRSWI